MGMFKAQASTDTTASITTIQASSLRLNWLQLKKSSTSVALAMDATEIQPK